MFGGTMLKYKKGQITSGIVSGITDYGIFVAFDEYYTGLIHISEISHGYVKNINNLVSIGDTIYVEIIDVDDELCHLKLSIKNINYKKNQRIKRSKIQETVTGFRTLNRKLPKWIEKSIKKYQNEI